MEIHAIQHWTGDVWHTIYMSTWATDVEISYNDLLAHTNAALRYVVFGVDNYDFVAIHARDFSVQDRSDLRERA
jgi:hypothetical protein